MRIADGKLKEFYRQQDHKKLDTIVHRLRGISEHTKFLQPIYDLLLQPEGVEPNEAALLKSAFDKYKNEEYFDALTDINQAIELAKNNPKNFLLRAYIYHNLYRDFHPGSYAGKHEKVREKYGDIWYKQAVEDYEKVVILAEDKNGEIAIEAKVRNLYLKSERALFSEGKTAKKLFEEAKKDIAALLNIFPNNEKIKSYFKLINDLESIHEESEGMIE